MKKILTLVPMVLFAASLCAQTSPTGTSTLSVTVGPEAAIAVNTSTTNFTEGSGGSFADFSANTAFTYWIRTSSAGSGGSITVKITSDFSPAGGPSVASPASGDAMTYTCTVQSPGTACSGAQTASTSSATAVAGFGQSANSAKAGNSTNSVTWDLPNDPTYAANSYSATATFTISAS